MKEMTKSNILQLREFDFDFQSKSAPLEEIRPIDSTEHALDTKRLKLAELQVVLAFFAFVLIGANDGAFGVLIPSLRMQYGVDKATIGLLFLVQSIGYLVAAFASGLLIEQLGNRHPGRLPGSQNVT